MGNKFWKTKLDVFQVVDVLITHILCAKFTTRMLLSSQSIAIHFGTVYLGKIYQLNPWIFWDFFTPYLVDAFVSTIVFQRISVRKVVFTRIVLFIFFFNFVIDVLLQTAFSVSPHSSVEHRAGETVSNLEYADDVVLLSEEPGSLQDLLCSSSKSAAMPGMRFAPPKWKMTLQNRVGVTPNVWNKGQFTERVYKFIHFNSCITPGCNISELHIQKALLAPSDWHHLWRRNGNRLSTKDEVYSAAMYSVLLYGSWTWPLKAEGIRRPSVFGHRCLWNIGILVGTRN